jgi:hypothetical protein
MHSRKTVLARSLILTIAAFVVSSASVFAAKPPARNATTADIPAPTAPPCPELTEVTGIYQDGNGTYLSGDEVVWAKTTNGTDLRIKPLCSAGRQLVTLLPEAAMALLSGDINSCQGSGGLNTIQLKIPDLQSAQTGVVGQPSSPGDAGVDSVKHYFKVDSNQDGSFGSDDDSVNLVWQSGIYLTRTEYSDRTVYELSTDLTSPYAELFINGFGAATSKGTFCVPLRLTVTRMK